MNALHKLGLVITFSTLLFNSVMAGGPVKKFKAEQLNKIKLHHGKDARDLFSGKKDTNSKIRKSDKATLALKRFIEQGVDPDLAVEAITEYYDRVKGNQSRSKEATEARRKAVQGIKNLFTNYGYNGEDMYNIIAGAGTTVFARETKTNLVISKDETKAACQGNLTVTAKRVGSVKVTDPDKLAQLVIMTMDGKFGILPMVESVEAEASQNNDTPTPE